MTHLNITLPTPKGRDLTEDENTALLGQWVTVLFMGESHMAQVEEVTVLPWDKTRMELLAKIGAPQVEMPEDVAPVFTRHAGVHLNCEHDPAPLFGQEPTCAFTYDGGPEVTPDRRKDAPPCGPSADGGWTCTPWVQCSRPDGCLLGDSDDGQA